MRETAGGEEICSKLLSMKDEQIVKKMFSNVRGDREDVRGLRLTNFGLTVMKKFFKFYQQKMPSGKRLMPLHLLYLDQHASMPYFCSDEEFIMFDHQLGLKIKLADGNMDIVMDIANVKSSIEN